MQNDWSNPNNKPNIIIHDNEKGTCVLTDVANLGDRYLIKKESEKIPHYKDLITEIQHIWNVKEKVTPANIFIFICLNISNVIRISIMHVIFPLWMMTWSNTLVYPCLFVLFFILFFSFILWTYFSVCLVLSDVGLHVPYWNAIDAVTGSVEWTCMCVCTYVHMYVFFHLFIYCMLHYLE